jgi:hypothetical protein
VYPHLVTLEGVGEDIERIYSACLGKILPAEEKKGSTSKVNNAIEKQATLIVMRCCRLCSPPVLTEVTGRRRAGADL